MIKSVKTCSSIYEVKYINGLKDGNDVLFGEIDFGLLQIKIGNKYPIVRQRQALLHECIHAISYEHQLGFNEKMIERLSNAIYAFMIDNKEFINEIIT